MFQNPWVLVTNLGDSSVLLPLGLLLAVMLWRFESARAAWLFLRSLILCAAALSLLKLMFISCGRVWHAGLESPSGHTGLSILVYGSLAAVAMNMAWPRTPFAAVPAQGVAAARPVAMLSAFIGIAALPLVAAIAVSRLALHAHTGLEVAVGALVGLGALAGFALPYRRLPHTRFPMGGFLILMLALLAVTYGENSPAEDLIRYLASFIVSSGNVCRG